MAKGSGTTRTSTSSAPKGIESNGVDITDKIVASGTFNPKTGEWKEDKWFTEYKKTKEVKPIPMNQVSVTGEDYYRFANGVKPKGRGSWAFEIGDKTEFIYGSYSEAKKEAIKRAAKLGISRVKLGS